MKNTILLCLALTGCVTTSVTPETIDKVQNAALIACMLAPTAGEIAALYTDDKNVATTTQAANILCAGLVKKYNF